MSFLLDMMSNNIVKKYPIITNTNSNDNNDIQLYVNTNDGFENISYTGDLNSNLIASPDKSMIIPKSTIIPRLILESNYESEYESSNESYNKSDSDSIKLLSKQLILDIPSDNDNSDSNRSNSNVCTSLNKESNIMNFVGSKSNSIKLNSIESNSIKLNSIESDIMVESFNYDSSFESNLIEPNLIEPNLIESNLIEPNLTKSIELNSNKITSKEELNLITKFVNETIDKAIKRTIDNVEIAKAITEIITKESKPISENNDLPTSSFIDNNVKYEKTSKNSFGQLYKDLLNQQIQDLSTNDFTDDDSECSENEQIEKITQMDESLDYVELFNLSSISFNCNIVIYGNRGSGKTTIVKNILQSKSNILYNGFVYTDINQYKNLVPAYNVKNTFFYNDYENLNNNKYDVNKCDFVVYDSNNSTFEHNSSKKYILNNKSKNRINIFTAQHVDVNEVGKVSHIFLGRRLSKSEIESVYYEISKKSNIISFDSFIDIYNKSTSQSNSFLVILVRNDDIKFYTYRSKIMKYDILKLNNNIIEETNLNSDILNLKKSLFDNVKKIYNDKFNDKQNIIEINMNPPSVDFIKITYSNDVKIILPKGYKVTYEYK